MRFLVLNNEYMISKYKKSKKNPPLPCDLHIEFGYMVII